MNIYDLRQVMQNPFMGWLVVEKNTNRVLAGVGHNPHRAWTFPLNTPRGLNVAQEYAFDHPFHNGVFVGQGNVRSATRMANFWAPAPDWRQPDNPIFQSLGTLKYGEAPSVTVHDDGVALEYRTTWLDCDRTPLLDERRTIRIRDLGDATACDVTSAKTAAYGDVEFGKTKFGSIGLRVQPQLLPPLGGQILAASDGKLRRGLADEVASGKACDFVAYEADVAGLGRFGVCMTILANSASERRDGPWFIRDYGMAMFNPTVQEAVQCPKGATWTCGLRVAAYDGALTPERAAAWVK